MSLATTTLTDVLEKLATLQAGISTGDGQGHTIAIQSAAPFFLVNPAKYPAFVNRVGPGQHTQTGMIVRQAWTIYMRLIVGTLQQGYDGQVERWLYPLMKAVPLYFAARPSLELPGVLSVELGTCTGISVWPNFPEAPKFLGTEFPITVTFQFTASRPGAGP
jgi:hypothetical protein